MTRTTSDVKTLIDNGADYTLILEALCKIPLEGEKEEWITSYSKVKKIPRQAIRDDVKGFIKKSIIQSEEQPEETFSDETEEKAIELLKSPDLLEKFLETTTRVGLVRERINKLCLLLAYTSRLLGEPISIIFLGPSSGGKSWITLGVLKFFPKSAYLYFSSITPKALFYLTGKELKHKILAISERAGSESADYSIRTFISEKELRILYTTKDPKTGEQVAKEIVKEGPISFIETSSNPKIHKDNLTRVFSLHVEESRDKVRAVLEETARGYSQGKADNIEEELQVWQCAQTLLESQKIKIPYATKLVDYFPTDNVRVQRDFKRFLSLIEASCLLHQYQREQDGDYLIAGIEDYRVAYEIGSVVLSQSIKGISPTSEKLLETINNLATEDKINAAWFERKNIESHLEWDKRSVNRHLKKLADKEYLDIESNIKGQAIIYSLVQGELATNINLPTPEELKNSIDGVVSHCPTSEQSVDSKGLEPGQGHFATPVPLRQPSLDLDNRGRPGQTAIVPPKPAIDKAILAGGTPGQHIINDIEELSDDMPSDIPIEGENLTGGNKDSAGAIDRPTS
jgi:hypothetical protein